MHVTTASSNRFHDLLSNVDDRAQHAAFELLGTRGLQERRQAMDYDSGQRLRGLQKEGAKGSG